MDIKEAEKIKLDIIEKRNHLSEIDIPLKYSKRNLYGGMQNRVRRQADKAFKQRVTKQRGVVDKNLQTVNKYINDLSIYNQNLSDYNIATSNPVDNSLMGIQTVTFSAPITPIAPNITLSSKPKQNQASMVRRRRIGINSRRFN